VPVTRAAKRRNAAAADGAEHGAVHDECRPYRADCPAILLSVASRKGHLVREIDALGGIMGLAADEAGIQFRLLNTSRGPAVWSPRAQEDKAGYRYVMRRLIEQTPNLFIKQAEVVEILFEKNRIAGIELLDGRPVVV